jgi:hypothetical protein
MARVAALETLCKIGWSSTSHVGVNAEQLRSCLFTHRLRDSRTSIASLRTNWAYPSRFICNTPVTGRAGNVSDVANVACQRDGTAGLPGAWDHFGGRGAVVIIV